MLVWVGAFSGCGYNTVIDKDEAVKASWSEVENQYQRRADLIPNLVNTVKGAANFEQETLVPMAAARQYRAILGASFALWAALFASWALGLEVPPLRQRVEDSAGILRPEQRQALEQSLADYEQRTGHQIAELTVPSLRGDPLEDFSIRVVEAWKLGDRKRDDGLLIVMALEERKVRIEVGYGLEGVVRAAL